MKKEVKTRLAVIYGGDSTERDISVITAIQAMKTLKKEYEIFALFMENNAFYSLENADEIKTYIKGNMRKKRVYLDKEGVFCIGFCGRKTLFEPDCVLLCTHGGKGENGALQGYLDIVGIPYTSAGVEASAIGMDKILSKTVFAAVGLDVLPYTVLDDASDKELKKVEKEIGFPLIIKPAGQGSSIGIAVAKNAKELKEAAGIAFEFDDRVIAERALTDFAELNCAVLIKGGKSLASELERPLSWEEFLTFEQKYIAGNGKISGGGRIYPADVSSEIREKVRNAALKVYDAIGAKGVVRIDFLLDNVSGKVYVNEANTIPGSLATYLFEENGMDYADVVENCVKDAILRSKCTKTTKFSSNVLDIYGKSSANACKMHGKIL